MATEHQFELSYSAPQNHHTYSLLELSPALLEQIEKGETRLDIVGLPSDESVMTTEADTLALRSVRSSNTMLLCQPSTSKQATNQEPSRLHSLASLNQTLDLVPVRPRVERIEELLRGQEWSNSDPTDYRPVTSFVFLKRVRNIADLRLLLSCFQSKKHKAYSEENLLDVVQASPKQLSDYLQKAHILQIGTRLRPVSPSYIPTLLSSLILSIDDSKGATDEDVFAKEAEITPTVARQVLSWYNQEGTINKAHVVKDIGLAILQSWPANELRSALALPGVTAAAPTRKLVVPLSKLLERWKKWAGPEQDLCTLDLLRVSL